MRFLRLLCLLLLLPFAAVAQDEGSDQDFITRMLQNALSGAGREVRIEGFAGLLSSRATIARLSIADAEGVWLEARDLALSWDRRALLQRRIDISEISAGEIDMLRAPVSEDAPPSAAAAPFRLPDLPVSIDIALLDVARINLGEAVLGEALALSLEGKVSLAGGEGTADISAERQDGGAGHFDIAGSYSNASRVLALDATLDEGPGGIVARLIGLRGAPSVRLDLEGTGPIDDYSAALVLATAGQERVTGSFGFVSVEGESRVRADLSGDVTPLIPEEYGAFFGPESHIAFQGRRDAAGNLVLDSLSAEAAALDIAASGLIGPDGWPLKLALDGRLGSEGGAPVALPFAGGAEARAAEIALAYDADEGPLWTGHFTAAGFSTGDTAIDSVSLSGSGEITHGAAVSFAADLAYEARGIAVADPGLAEALGPELSGTLRFGRAAGQDLGLEHFTLAGPGITASGSGNIALPEAGPEAKLTLDLLAEDLSRFAALAGLSLSGGANLTLTLHAAPGAADYRLWGEGGTTDLALGLADLDPLLGGRGRIGFALARDTTGTRVERLHIATAGVTVDGTADLQEQSGEARFTLAVPEISRAVEGLSGPVTLEAVLDYGMDGMTVTAEAAGADVSASVSALLANGRWQGEAGFSLADLSPFSARAGVPLGGALALQLTGDAAQDFSTFALTLEGTSNDLAAGPEQVAALLAGPGTITGAVTGDGGLVRFTDLAVKTAALDLAASGTLQGGVLATDAGLRLTDLSVLEPGLSGALAAEGAARLGSGALSADVRIAGPAATSGTLALRRTDGPLGFEVTLAAPDLAALATGQQIIPLPLSGSATLRATGTSAEGVRADIAAGFTDLSIGVAQTDALLAGQGRLTGQFTLDDGALRLDDMALQTPALTATAEARRGADGALAARLDLARLSLSPLSPGLAGSASGLALFSQTPEGLRELRASAEGPGQMALSLTAAGPAAGAMEVALDLSAASLSPWSGLAGRPLSGGIDLSATGTADPANAGFDLALDARASALSVGVPALTTLLAGEGRLSGRIARGADGVLSVQGLEADWPRFSARAALDETEGGARGTFSANVTDIGLFVPDLSGPATARGTAELAGGTWHLDAGLTGPGGTEADISGSYAGGSANLAASGTLPLAFANAYMAPQRLNGAARFDLRLTGAPALQNLSGSLTTSGAELTLPTVQSAINQIDARVTLAGGTASVNLTGHPSAGGALDLGGTIGLGSGLPADLTLEARRFIRTDPQLYETQVDGTLRLVGPLAGGARITGGLQLGATEIRVPSSNFSLLGELPDVRHQGASPQVALTLDRAGLTLAGTEQQSGNGGSGGPAYGLDITISAPNQIFVRGRGLDAELGGSLRLTGTTRDIIPEGSFSLIRGRLSILGQRFDLTEGSATLQGDFDPYLSLAATTTTADDIAVTIRLSGAAMEPQVDFISAPELPQDEVLSHLLFGTDVATITPLQAVQLAAAVSTLAGRGGGGLIDSFRQGLGVDDLDISTDEAGNAALSAGKYLSENIYADVTVGAESTAVELNLDLTDSVTARGSVDSTGETRLGIYYEHDY